MSRPLRISRDSGSTSGGKQGAGAGSLYVGLAFTASGVLTYVFQSLSARTLGPEVYGGLAVLWSATFLVSQVLWVGVSQTLGRYIAERQARGEGWEEVIRSARRLQISLLAVFLAVCLPALGLISDRIFGGDTGLALAFVAAVSLYALEYFRRGVFSGHRRFSRLGALHVTESASRAALAIALLAAGSGVAGPALAVVLAPLVGVLLVRPPSGDAPPDGGPAGEPFSAASAIRFSAPVLACVAAAQLLLNGGPLLAVLLGGAEANALAGVLLAALILTRAPQYVLSPVIQALLPQASRVLASDGPAAFERLVARAGAAVLAAGAALVAGIWLLGEFGMRLLYGPGFEVPRGVLVALAVLAAAYLLCELLSQALFASGRARFAALGWFAGLVVAAVSVAATWPGADAPSGVALAGLSYPLALGAVGAAVALAALYAATRRDLYR